MDKKYRNPERFWKLSYCILFAVVSALVIWKDCQFIKEIRNADIQSYQVQGRNLEYVPVQSEAYQREFTAVGKETVSIDLFLQAQETAVSGMLDCEITNQNGNVIFQCTEQDICNLVTDEGGKIHFDLSDVSLQQGQSYTVHMEFSDCNNLYVWTDDGGPVLLQQFLFTHSLFFILFIIASSSILLMMIFLIGIYGLQNRFYVMLFLFLGLLFVFVIPPASVDDEYRHFIRTYTLARGESDIALTMVRGDECGLFTAGYGGDDYVVTVPKEISDIRLLDFCENYNDISYYAEVNQTFCIDKAISILKSEESKETARVSVAGTVEKGMVSYWPQVIMVWLGKQTGVRSLWLFYLARMGQLLAGVLFGWIALKLAPEYKNMIWLLSFIPNSMRLQASCNRDGLLISEILLYTALILWLRKTRADVISKKALPAEIGILLLLYSIAYTKIPYIFFCLAMLLLLKKENFLRLTTVCRYKKKWVFLFSAAGVLLIIAVCIFGRLPELMLTKLYTFLPEAHVKYIMEYPKVIWDLFTEEWGKQGRELLVAIRDGRRVRFDILLVLSLLFCKKRLLVREKVWTAFVFSGMIMLIVLVGYTLTPPDYGRIWGITYRYLLPVLPAAALVFPFGSQRTQQLVSRMIPLFIALPPIICCFSWLVGLDMM